MTTELTWQQVIARRLARHHLKPPVGADSPDATPADVVRAVCGAHAQVLSAAELSIGLRIPGSTRQVVREALWEERSLVKTFGPRGTVHLLPTEDLPLWTGALAALPGGPELPDSVRLTPEQRDEVIAAIAETLADADLTVDELSEQVIAKTGSWAGDLVMPAFQGYWPRWRQAISAAANAGALCYGPNKGRNVTYTNPHRWLPGFRPLASEEALAELLRRYLHSYGPAAPQHFAQWLSTPKAFITNLFKSLAHELVEVDLDGRRAWQLASDLNPSATGASADASASGAPAADASATEPSGVHLLPYFDAYAVGSHPRDVVFPGNASERALNGGQAGNYPVLLVNGLVAGVWHHRRSGRKLHVTVEPIRKLTARQRRQLDDQVDRVATILEAQPTLTIGPVTVGPHA